LTFWSSTKSTWVKTQDIGVKFDTAYPGIDILVQATNNDAANIMTTTIGMFGYAAER
jgi:hypothetical protein